MVVKSTVPIGTNDKVEQFIHDFLVRDVKVEVASNPEFLAQGTAVRDTLHATFTLQSGGSNETAANADAGLKQKTVSGTVTQTESMDRDGAVYGGGAEAADTDENGLSQAQPQAEVANSAENSSEKSDVKFNFIIILVIIVMVIAIVELVILLVIFMKRKRR